MPKENLQHLPPEELSPGIEKRPEDDVVWGGFQVIVRHGPICTVRLMLKTLYR